jgi:hypothetical protein
MDFETVAVISCWFTVAIISSFYMIVFGKGVDIMFGVLLPIGFLVFVAVIVTFIILSNHDRDKLNNKGRKV